MNFHIPPFRQREIGWASLPTGSPSSSAGAGAWEEVLGRASSRSACPLWPRCQRGREGAEKAKQEKRSQSHRASALVFAQKIWNPHGVCKRRSVWGFEPLPKKRGGKKKVNKNHRVWLAGQRAGAVTWTVDCMSCHLAVGFWAAGGTSLGRRIEVNTYMLSLLVWQIYVQLSFRYSESAFRSKCAEGFSQ